MRLSVTSIFLAAVLMYAGVGAAPAGALPPGVHLDPGSPSGKQYAFPLQVLRGAATGHAAPQGAAPPPLFGVGIGPGARGGSRGGGRSSSSGVAAGRSSLTNVKAGRRSLTGTRRGSRGRAGSIENGSSGSRSVPGSGPGSRSDEGQRARDIASLIRPSSPVPHVGLLGTGVLLAGLLLGGSIAAIRRRG